MTYKTHGDKMLLHGRQVHSIVKLDNITADVIDKRNLMNYIFCARATEQLLISLYDHLEFDLMLKFVYFTYTIKGTQNNVQNATIPT